MISSGAAMISSHAISKGTFRLSIVAAVAAAAYTAYEGCWRMSKLITTL